MRLDPSSVRRRRRHRSRGQSLVEFALILPIMLVFFAGVLDLGRVFYATITLNNAAREGAFQAAQTPDSFRQGQPCDTDTNLVTCRVQLESKNSGVSIAPGDITLNCSDGGCPEQAGSTATVGVTGQFRLITPLLSLIFGGQTIPMSARAIAQLEYLPEPNTATAAPGPVAVFTWSPSTILVGTTVSFNGSGSSGDPTDWQWDFGDGDTAVGSATVTHTYGTAGPFTVTLTAINTTGTDSDSQTITVTSLSTPTPTPTATTGTTPTPAPTPTPTPFQCYPPNVIGQNPSTAQANLIAAAFTVVLSGDLTNGQKNKIQAQNPDHTTCLAPGATISIHYRPN